MYHLLRLQIVLSFLLIGAIVSKAQKSSSDNYNARDFQNKAYYFGITLGINNANFRIQPSNEFILNDSISSVNSLRGSGFNLGIVSNLRIGDYFDFRFLPTLSFAERNLQYTTPRNVRPPFVRKIESVLVELPFQVRFKSAPYHDKRVFVLAGVKYAFDVASDSRSRQSVDLVKISPTDFSFEYGAGVQFFFPYFIFSPEIKFSYGLGNVLIYDNNLEQSRVVEKLLTRGFTISFHFEG